MNNKEMNSGLVYSDGVLKKQCLLRMDTREDQVSYGEKNTEYLKLCEIQLLNNGQCCTFIDRDNMFSSTIYSIEFGIGRENIVYLMEISYYYMPMQTRGLITVWPLTFGIQEDTT